jgi:AcrR family transcriptional regulator
LPRAPELPPEPSLQDGRVQRGARNRERIVEALIELIRAGSLKPTAEEVAARAEVGTRTVFRHFDDMEALYAEMDQTIQKEAAKLNTTFDPAGSLDDRIDNLIEQRAAVFEFITPFKRAAALQLWRSNFLRARRDKLTQGLRLQLLIAFPELAKKSAAHRHAAELAASFESWSRLRGDQGLSRDAAASAIKLLLHSMLDER